MDALRFPLIISPEEAKMMSKLLITTAAAALLIGGSVAMAQSPNEKGAAPARAPAAQQNAPAEKIAPKMETKGAVKSKSETTGQGMSNDEKAGAKGGAQMKPDEKAAPKGSQMKSEEKGGAKGNAQMKPEEKSGAAKGQASEKSNAQMKNKEAQDKEMKSKSGAAANDKGKASGNATTGQGAAASHANLTTEQRTKITTVIKKQSNVRPVEHVNFNISVGTRVPRDVHFYPLPAEVITVYPAWRGYEFILVGDQIVIINPSSFEIVAVIAA